MVVIEWLGISEGAAQAVGAAVLLALGVVAWWKLPEDWDDVDGAAA